MVETRRVGLAMRIDQPFPMNQEIYAGVQRFIREHPHWKCEITELPLNQDEQRSKPFDGLIVREANTQADQLRALGIPVVNTRYKPDHRDLSVVYVDTRQAGELIADHLIERGFQRLAYVVDRDMLQANAICQAFADEAEQRGQTCVRQYFNTSGPGTENYWRAVRHCLESLFDKLEPPVGVLFAFPWMTRLAVTMAEDHGWHVPQDMALVSLENITMVLDHPPEITSIDLNYEKIGYEAAAMLDRMMDGQQTEPQQIYVPPRGMITRASTDYFVVKDEVVAAALRYISQHLRDKLTVDQLAEQMLISPRSLQLRFEAALNRPISEEVRRLRLEAAKRLLRDGELQIGQIARQVGFNSPVTINNVFHRELGMSPSQYRKKLKGSSISMS